MANTLEYILKIKDEATSQLQKFSGELKNTGSTISSLGTQFNNFGKQAIGGFTVAAGGVMALGKELDLLTRGGQLLDVENAFNRLAMNAGSSGQKLMDTFQQVTDGTVSNADLMQRSVKASMLGIPIDKMSNLMEIARTQAVTMGEDVGYMLDSIVTGVGRASPLILDNLGITLKMGEVYDNAAKKLGKTAEAMTDAERRTALLNAVVAWGEQKQKDMGGAVDSNAASTQKLVASLTNLKNNVLQELAKTLTPIIDKFNELVKSNPELIMGLIKFAGAMAVLIPTLAIIGGAINGIIGVVGILTTGLQILAAVIGFLLTPFGLIVLAIAAVIAIGYLLITHWEQVKTIAMNVFETLKNGVLTALAAIGGFFTSIGTAISDFFTQLPENIKNFLWEASLKLIEWVAFILAYLIFGIPQWIETIITNLKTLPGRMWEWLSNAYNNVVQWGTNVWGYLSTQVPQWISNVVTWFSQLPGKIRQALSTLKTEIGSAFSDAWDNLVGTLKEWGKNIWEWGKNIATSFIEGFKNALSGIANAFKDGVENARKSMEGHSPPENGPLKNIDKWGYNIGNAWVDGLKSAISDFNMPTSGNTYTNNINVSAPINNNLDPYNLASILGQQLAFSGQYD